MMWDEYRKFAVSNIATNWRLFCVMIFAANVAEYLNGGGVVFMQLAVISAFPVGLSCIVEKLKPGRLQTIAARATYSLAGVVALSTLLLIR